MAFGHVTEVPNLIFPPLPEIPGYEAFSHPPWELKYIFFWKDLKLFAYY